MRLEEPITKKPKGQISWLRIITPQVHYLLCDKLPNPRSVLPEYCLEWASQVACGLAYLHSLSPPRLHLSLNRCDLLSVQARY